MAFSRRYHQQAAYRSGLEVSFARDLEARGVPYTYEDEVIRFMQPEKPRRYTPDFIVTTQSGKKIVVETKGMFTAADRQKHLWVREQHPEVDLRFVFNRSKAKISKTSKTTYAAWCEKNGFLYADKLIPQEWLDE